jgi:hypothetical protein
LSYFSKHMFHFNFFLNPFSPFLLLTLAFKVSMMWKRIEKRDMNWGQKGNLFLLALNLSWIFNFPCY